MNKQESQFNLLNGTFTGIEAKEVLVALFSDKIRLNSLRNFSHQERFGIPDMQATQRIPELKQTLEEIVDFLRNCDENDRFELYADISVSAVSLQSEELVSAD
jgi:hypothetical protein